MSYTHHVSDEGLVLKKIVLGERDVLLTLLSKSKGKLTVRAYGVKKITSRRISHLETGNYIRFSLTKYHDKLSLGETELLWGYSQIKDSSHKLELLYLLFVILNKILPEEHHEEQAFTLVLDYLKQLNNNESVKVGGLDTMLKSLLMSLGYIDQKTARLPLFNPVSFVEGLVDRKINRSYFR